MEHSEACVNVIQIIKENEHNGGITKNEACRQLTQKYGGSRSTWWKAFGSLLGSGKIEARIVPPNKQKKTLFPTDKSRKVDGLRYDLTIAEKLIDLIERTPLLGDCYKNPKMNKDLIPSNHLEVERVSKNTDKEVEFYTLQARHDILEKMPLFLINYINDKNNKFLDVKKECKEIIIPLIIRNTTILQNDYSESAYCSNQFLDDIGITTHILLGKTETEANIPAEFLKILGRYYYLISEKFSKKFIIDSSEEQKVISDFVRTFYSKSQFKYDEDNEHIPLDVISSYFIDPLSDNIDKQERIMLDKVMNGPACRVVKKYILYRETDPIRIHEYYVKWFLTLSIFSNLEKEIVTLLTEWVRMDFEEHLDNNQ